jgi:leader peptidase (prepilin peptidase)/N-methyltransferase
MYSMTMRPSSVSIPHVTIAAVLALLLVVMLVSAEVEPACIAGLVALVPAALGALTDARQRRIPNELVVAAAVPGLILALWAIGSGEPGGVGPMVQGVMFFGGPLFAIHLLEPAAMGFGDVKLAAVLGLTVGAIEPRLAIVALAVAALGTVLTGVVRRRSALPFAPGLVGGAATALILTFATGLEPLV